MVRQNTITEYFRVDAQKYAELEPELVRHGIDSKDCENFKILLMGDQGDSTTDNYYYIPSEKNLGDLFDSDAIKLKKAVYHIRSGDSLSKIANKFEVGGGYQALYSANKNNPFIKTINLILADGYMFISSPEDEGIPAVNANEKEKLEQNSSLTTSRSKNQSPDLFSTHEQIHSSLGSPDKPDTNLNRQEKLQSNLDQGEEVSQEQVCESRFDQPLPHRDINKPEDTLPTPSLPGNIVAGSGAYMLLPGRSPAMTFGTFEMKNVINTGEPQQWIKARVGQDNVSIAAQFPRTNIQNAYKQIGFDLRAGTRGVGVGLRVKPFGGGTHFYGRIADPIEGHRIVFPVKTPGLGDIPDTISLKIPAPERNVWGSGRATEALVSRRQFFSLIQSIPEIGAEEASIRLQQMTKFSLENCRKLISMVAAGESFITQSNFSEMLSVLKRKGLDGAAEFLSKNTSMSLDQCKSGLALTWSITGFAGLVFAEFLLYMAMGILIDEGAEIFGFDPQFDGRLQTQIGSTVLVSQGLRAGATYFRTGQLPAGLAGTTLSTLGWTGVGLVYNDLIGDGIDLAAEEFNFDPNFYGRGVAQFTGTTTGIIGTRYTMQRATTFLNSALYSAPTQAELSMAVSEAMTGSAAAGTAAVAPRAAASATSVASATTLAEGSALTRAFTVAKGPALATVALVAGCYVLEEYTKSDEQRLAEQEIEDAKNTANAERKNEEVILETLTDSEKMERENLAIALRFVTQSYCKSGDPMWLERLNLILSKPDHREMFSSTPRYFADVFEEAVKNHVKENPPPALSGDNPQFELLESWEQETNSFLEPIMQAQMTVLNSNQTYQA